MRMIFIGAGKMATALAAAVVQSKLLPAENVLALDPNAAAREAFAQATGVRCVEQADDAVRQADVLLLAIKPQVAEAAVKGLPAREKNPLVISICAGIPIAKISLWTGSRRVIRVMPNTPLMVGAGASCFAAGAEATQEDVDFADALLGRAGKAWRVTEDLLDAVTALSGSGPAYVFEMAKAMAMAGEAVGLDAGLSLDLTVQTLAGAAKMLLQKKGTPDQLRDAVTSPHGTTYEGLQVMAKADFRGMMRDAVTAARDRSVELGRG